MSDRFVCTGRHWSAFALMIAVIGSTPARAQSLNTDARGVGLGGIERADEVFASDGTTATFQFAIPLGIFQLLADRDALRPDSDGFDPSLSLEYGALPRHWVIGRKPSPARARFMADIRQASLSRDLNSYRGFVPAAALEGAGTFSPTWGKTFRVRGTPGGLVHKVYVGGGPYMSIRTVGLFDQRLVSLLGASSAEYIPSSSLEIGNQSSGQLAMQVTGGYRAELPWMRGGARLATLQFEADYNHLHGFRYEDVDLNVRLDTDPDGLLAFDRSRGAPLAIDRRFSSSGRGYAVDVGAAAVFNRWRVGVRGEDLGNRINWRGVQHREYEMAELINGSRIVTTTAEVVDDVRSVLPVRVVLHGAYQDAAWGAVAELERGYQNTASAGLERRFDRFQVRAGGRLVNRVVLPAAGASVKAGAAWFDVGAAMSTANIERERNIVLALGIRFSVAGPAVQGPQ